MKKVTIISTDSLTNQVDDYRAEFSNGIRSPLEELLYHINMVTGVDELQEQPILLDDTIGVTERIIIRKFENTGTVLTDAILDKA